MVANSKSKNKWNLPSMTLSAARASVWFPKGFATGLTAPAYIWLNIFRMWRPNILTARLLGFLPLATADFPIIRQ
jgi:hypothetical protein